MTRKNNDKKEGKNQEITLQQQLQKLLKRKQKSEEEVEIN